MVLKLVLFGIIKYNSGKRQGCVLSPDLHSIYIEIINVGGCNNNLRCTALIADNETGGTLKTAMKESDKKGLSLNRKKKETMLIISRDELARPKQLYRT